MCSTFGVIKTSLWLALADRTMAEANGRNEDFDRIFWSTQETLRGLIAGMGMALGEVDALAQDVYFRLFSDPPDETPPPDWLEGEARRVCLKRLADKDLPGAPYRRGILEVMAHTRSSWDRSRDEKSAREILRQAVGELTNERKQLVACYYKQCLEIPAIADLMDSSIAAVQAMLLDLRRALKDRVTGSSDSARPLKHRETVAKFMEDRDGLSDLEQAELSSTLRREPDQAALLKDLMVFDDFLSRALTVNRRNFDRKLAHFIRQRTADPLTAHRLDKRDRRRASRFSGRTSVRERTVVSILILVALAAVAGGAVAALLTRSGAEEPKERSSPDPRPEAVEEAPPADPAATTETDGEAQGGAKKGADGEAIGPAEAAP